MIRYLKKIGLFMAFAMMIYGIQIICVWHSMRQDSHKEGNTLEEIGLEDFCVGEYASFYIDDYIDKEVYVDGSIEYEIYTILIEHIDNEQKNRYIQVIVTEQDTKEKLKNLSQGKVYFQGQMISAPYGGFAFNKDLFIGTDEIDYFDNDKLILTSAIMQTELPEEKNNRLYKGIVFLLLSIVIYRIIGGVKGCVPNVDIKSNKYDEYNFEYFTQTHNIRNEWMCENDNLKNLLTEQIAERKSSNVMIVIFVLGFLLLVGDASYFRGTILGVVALVLKVVGCVFMYIGIGGVWSRFINSSHKLAIYIAYKRRKRSIYIEIETCKKNMKELERIMEEKNMSAKADRACLGKTGKSL